MTLTQKPVKRSVLPSEAAQFKVLPPSGACNIDIFPLTNYTFGHWLIFCHKGITNTV